MPNDHAAPSFARAVAAELDRPRRVLVLTHVRPDGDAVGSGLALASMLRELGHTADVVLDENVPRRYLFLDEADRIRSFGAAKRADDALVIVVDATGPARLGKCAALFEAAARTVNIDHHVSNSNFADVNWVDPDAAAVGGMIYRLAREMNWSLTPAARDALYVAIMTDTGRFTYSNTNPEALSVAAGLVRAGADPERLSWAVYGHRTLDQWELERRVRASLELDAGGRVASIGLSMHDFDETGTTPADTDDFASLPRQLEGVEVGLFFYEIDDGERTKVGVRTSRGADANVIASRFGGGGHPRAAGCTVDGPLEAVHEEVIAEVTALRVGGRGERSGGQR